MLSFAVTIRPNEENLGVTCLRLDIVCNRLLILIDVDVGGGLEELTRCTRPPSFELRIKVNTGQVAKHTGHDNRAIAPFSKVVVEFVVLDILIATDRVLLRNENKVEGDWGGDWNFTVWILPPDRCWATALAIAGFSATHRILWPGMAHVGQRIQRFIFLYLPLAHRPRL